MPVLDQGIGKETCEKLPGWPIRGAFVIDRTGEIWIYPDI